MNCEGIGLWSGYGCSGSAGMSKSTFQSRCIPWSEKVKPDQCHSRVIS
jgi:hypothetical protein